jgi:branched-chain amino acid transport system permease protein
MLGSVFCSWILYSHLDLSSSSPSAWGWVILTLLGAMVFCCVLNVAVERLAYRRLRDAPKLAPLIAAVGVSFIFQNIGLLWNGSTPKLQPTIIANGEMDVGGIRIPYAYLLPIVVTIPLLIALLYIVRNTRAGKAMRATAQDPDASRLMGIDVDRTIAFTFALGGAMAGAAGLVYLEANGTVRYDAGFQLGLIAFTAAVLGGVGNLVGAVVGAVVIGLIQGWNDGLPHGLGNGFSQTVVFTILIGVMVFRPSGLLGATTTEKV